LAAPVELDAAAAEGVGVVEVEVEVEVEVVVVADGVVVVPEVPGVACAWVCGGALTVAPVP
jgi:hypothetical protein